MSNSHQFIEAIKQHGITPPDFIIEDGFLHRFSSNGKPGDNAGWYCYYPGEVPAGNFGCWRSDIKQTWFAKIGRKLTTQELSQNAERLKKLHLQREAETFSREAEAEVMANKVWNQATTILDHEYLTKKGVKPFGIKQIDSQLLIPIGQNGSISSLEYISKNGFKSRLPGGRVKGCYFCIGTPKDVIIFVEGYATGASIHEATGDAVIVTFGKDNLLRVVPAIKAQHPNVMLIICADDDTSGVGTSSANKVSSETGVSVTIPIFGENRPIGANDFNDLHQFKGLEAVKQQIETYKLSIKNSHETNTKLMPEALPSLPDVISFDFDYLPNVLRDFVRDISERMQCPPDFAAVGALVMMATIIGRKVGIRPMRFDDWTVTPNLWGAVVGNSGVMKSPTLSASMSPIKKLQKKAFETFNSALAEKNSLSEIAKMNESINKAKAKKILEKDRTADVKSLLENEAPSEVCLLKRYITNNSSYEALGELLIENNNGLMIEADEIVGLLKQLDTSGQEAAKAFYLTAADGDKSYTFDRIIRGKGLHIPAVCLSIIGGIQPGVLAEYVQQATSGGSGADGLLQRFGLMVYPDVSPHWKEVDRFPDNQANLAVNQLADYLDKLNPLIDIKTESDDACIMPFMRFDKDAQILFSEWRSALEIRVRNGDEHPAIVSHLSKYRKLIPTLALINHLCDYDEGAVTEKSLLRAIAYSEYLESHARRIYVSGTRPDIDAANFMLKKISRGKLPNPFRVREVYRKNWTGLDTEQKAKNAINLLVEYNHLTLEEIITGGRPTTHYHYNGGEL